MTKVGNEGLMMHPRPNIYMHKIFLGKTIVQKSNKPFSFDASLFGRCVYSYHHSVIYGIHIMLCFWCLIYSCNTIYDYITTRMMCGYCCWCCCFIVVDIRNKLSCIFLFNLGFVFVFYISYGMVYDVVFVL